MSSRLSIALLSALAVSACDRLGVEPTDIAESPRYNFTSGPAELPNVMRFEQISSSIIIDPDEDLVALIGYPPDPRTATNCGGSNQRDPLDTQVAGLFRDANRRLIVAEDVGLHLYRWSTFFSPCTDLPVAAGTGRVVFNANDPPMNGTLTAGLRMVGTLEDLVSGGEVRLVGLSRLQINKDGSGRFLMTELKVH